MTSEITAESVWSHIPKRPRESNKGSFGAVLAVAGSACYRGAASLTVEGALKSGEYELAGNVSSQFISGLLFALPLLAGDSTLHLIPPVESRSYIEMTRAAQRRFGVESRWQDENTLFPQGPVRRHLTG